MQEGELYHSRVGMIWLYIVNIVLDGSETTRSVKLIVFDPITV